jgi:hypothetical protein
MDIPGAAAAGADHRAAGNVDGEAKFKGVKLGQEVAAKILEERERDGASAADAYRPKTKPGVYIPTPITYGWALATMTPFTLASPSQFSSKASALAQECGMDQGLQ